MLLGSMLTEKSDVNIINSTLQELNELIINKSRALDFRIKQFEGESENGDGDEKTNQHHHRHEVDLHKNKLKIPHEEEKTSTKDTTQGINLKNLSENNKRISDQLDKLQNKINSLNIELFNRVKKDVVGK